MALHFFPAETLHAQMFVLGGSDDPDCGGFLQAVIADRDAMRVAPEVAQNGGRAAEGRLGVHDPVGVEEGTDVPFLQDARQLTRGIARKWAAVRRTLASASSHYRMLTISRARQP